MEMSKHQETELARHTQPHRQPTQLLTHTHTDTLSSVFPIFYLHRLHTAQLCISLSLIPLYVYSRTAHDSIGSGLVLSMRHSFERSANNEVDKWLINVCVNEQRCH